MFKHIIFIGCNLKQIKYLKFIKSKNYKVILIDQNSNSPGRQFSDFFFRSSYLNINRLQKFYFKYKNKNITGIFTASSQFAYLGCSYLAKKFNIPFPSKKIIDICLNKIKFYNFAKKNGLKVPESQFISNKKNLKKILKKIQTKQIYFLKSDYGKSPNYIYKGDAKQLQIANINWNKDQFFKKQYILQKNFNGKNLRFNIFNSKYEIYDFYKNFPIKKEKYPIIDKLKILPRLFQISKKLNMSKKVLKFDIILKKTNYVVLDIGLDPPFRMLNYWKKNKKDFLKFYIKLYLGI